MVAAVGVVVVIIVVIVVPLSVIVQAI